MMGSIRILRRHLTVFRRTWLSNTVIYFFEPLFYLSAFGLGLGAFVSEMEGMAYLQFIASGMVASTAMWAATFECTYGAFIRMQFQKTFHAMLFTPLTITHVVWGEVLYGALKSALFSGVILLVITFFGQVSSLWALTLPFINLLPGIAFSLLALSYAGLVNNIDYLNYYISLIVTPLFLVSGVFFPVSSLPGWLQSMAWINPLYHSVELSRLVIRGQITSTAGGHMLFLAVFALAVSYLPVYLMRRKLID